MAQAFQFECTMRQKDIIGEWVPINEPGISDVIYRGRKWLRGLRWEEIDENLVLRHVTSKKDKEAEVDLKLAPMVLEELQEYCGGQPVVTTDPVTKKVTARRDLLPAAGPVILCEIHAFPWYETEFRRKWRKVANECGIPKNVLNMDSRSGAISEAIAAGVPLEFVRHAATHSDIAQTQQYDRIQAKATRRVMEARIESRKKPGTE
jgi:integrase